MDILAPIGAGRPPGTQLDSGPSPATSTGAAVSRIVDIQRPSSLAATKRRRRLLIGIGVVALAATITLALSHLEPAAPTVERATVWIDTVKRGPMLRQVRGPGTLVPDQVLWIPASTEGTVERILVKPGSQVRSDTPLLQLRNPELEVAVMEAASLVSAAEAESANL